MPTFLDCVKGELAARRIGKKRSAELITRYEGLTKQFLAAGHAMPENEAARKMLLEIDFETRENKRRKLDTLAKFAAWGPRIDRFDRNVAIRGKRAETKDFSITVRAGIENDPRSGALSVMTHKENLRSQLYSLMGEGMNEVTKGFLGRQRGKAHLRNFIPELEGKVTNDAAARELAAGWRRMTEAIPRLWREAGGTMNEIAGPYLPEPETAVRLTKAGRAAYERDALQRIDWSRTTWPDGSPIDPADRLEFVQTVFATKASSGMNKINRSGLRGQGRAFGNLLDQHRLVHYKPEDWLYMHDKYGDGSIFDMMVNYVEDMSHKIALLRIWGANPDMMYQSVKAKALARAEALDAQARAGGEGVKDRTAVSITEAGFKNVVDPMFEAVTRHNPMDPESLLGTASVTLGNLLTSAQLGGAALLALPGDFVTSVAARLADGFGARSFGGMGFYFQALLTQPKEAQRIAFQTGFIMDEVLSTYHAMERYTGMASVGPAWSRRVADGVLRASALTPHTKAARYAVRMESMAFLASTVQTPFDQHPMRQVFARYGIEAADWDAFRSSVQPWMLKGKVPLLRPIDLLNSTLPNRQRLFDKFQGMIWDESRSMVIDARIEGATRLKGSTRPDTLLGAVAYSFGMYKSFPMSLMMVYSRLAMAMGDPRSRLTLIAGLGAGLTLAGALGMQMREIAAGRDPMSMQDPGFWGKAILAGGALSVLGDFIFTGINEYGSGPQDVIAGPSILFIGDTLDLAGNGFEWVTHLAGLGDAPARPFASKVADYASRYTPGQNIWWAKLALQREFWDRLQVLLDPGAYQRFAERRRRRQRDFGNDYFSPPGSGILDARAPEFEGVFQ